MKEIPRINAPKMIAKATFLFSTISFQVFSGVNFSIIKYFIKDNIVYEKPCVKLYCSDKTSKFFYYDSEEECQKGFEEIIQQLKEMGVKLL